MITFYVGLNTPKDRCGCRSHIIRIIEANAKLDIRKKFKGSGYSIDFIFTSDEVEALPTKDRIINNARY